MVTKVATRLAVLAAPIFCNEKLTVTGSPGFRVPLVTGQVSTARPALPAMMNGVLEGGIRALIRVLPIGVF